MSPQKAGLQLARKQFLYLFQVQ